ncbi:trafficking protein particle complex subunit 4 [Clonorchis sinensis]|uniref:Trafficking protein particle complex subunit n=1 Tax=Clonorchis sinensis TaxID=79923 RepID=G7YW41_CLOSI|nr:trafficking protein particle complex subunit 4 [Clonorchis sinensis]
MSVHSLYVISESGSLQFYYDHSVSVTTAEKTFSYPIPLRLASVDGRICVDFGTVDEVKPGYAVLSVNNIDAGGTFLEDGREILQVLSDKSNYPVTVKFGRPRLRPNDRIQLASMFQPLHQMARHLSPVIDSSSDPSDSVEKSQTTNIWNSGIQSLESSACRIHCLESKTGVKFLLVTDAKLPSACRESLRRVYEAYTDYVLKNPFYSSNQPFNFDFFTNQVRTICEQIEKGIYGNT